MPYIRDPSVFTTELSKKIAVLMASSIRVNSADLNLLSPSYTYLRDEISRLKQCGVIVKTKETPLSYRFTPYGLERLAEELPWAYAYYMAISNGNDPGRSESHKLRIRKQSQIHACMMAAGVEVGAERPFLRDYFAVKRTQPDPNQPRYLPVKEVKVLKGDVRIVAQAREQLSRASGMLFSWGLKAAVYDLMGEEGMKVQLSVEKQFQLLMGSTYWEIYRDGMEHYGKQKALVLGDEKAVISMLKKYRWRERPQQKRDCDPSFDPKKVKRSTTIYRAMTDIKKWPVEFHFVPQTSEGYRTLRVLTAFTPAEIFRIMSEHPDYNGRVSTDGSSLSIDGEFSYEFLSCNVGQLERIKRFLDHHPDQKLLVSCWTHQREFVREFFEKTPCEIVATPLEKFERCVGIKVEHSEKQTKIRAAIPDGNDSILEKKQRESALISAK